MMASSNAKFDISFQPATGKDLSLREKVGVVFVAAKLVAALPYLVIRAFFGGNSKSGKSWIYELRSRILFFTLSRLHPRQINLTNPPSAVRIKAVSTKLKIGVTVDEVEGGGKIHWWGQKKGAKVILHVHGGGYNLSIGEHHLLWLHSTQELLKKKDVDTDIAILEYSLTPTARYPTQMIQSVEALRFLITQCRYDPANIIISGDSAGGALVLSIASHILHPHPAIQPLVLPESSPKLGGLIAMSPWTSFATNYNSMQNPTGKDVVLPYFVETWSRWLVDRPDEPRHDTLPSSDEKYTWDEYNQAGQADPSWWTGFPVKKSIVLIGDDETLRDSIVDFGVKFREGVEKDVPAGAEPTVDIVLCEGEIHTECLYDTFVGKVHQVPGKMAEAIWSFIESVFKAEEN